MNIVYSPQSEQLAKSVARDLEISCFPALIKNFSCGEMQADITESLDSEVVVIADTVDNDSWIRLFLILNSLRNISKITVCLTYMGYLRQDKDIDLKSKADSMFLKLLETFGNIVSFIFIDCHNSPNINIPYQHLSVSEMFAEDILSKYPEENIMVVSPDEGRVHQAAALANLLKCAYGNCRKTRDNKGIIQNLFFEEDVNNRLCILYDDIIDTGETIGKAADVLIKSGAKEVAVYATHGVFSCGAQRYIDSSNISQVVVTDSISEKKFYSWKIEKLSLTPLIVKAIHCILW